MTRIMCKTETILTCLTLYLLLMMTGCSDDYEHERLGPDAKRFKQAAAMLTELRTAGLDGLEALIARAGADLPLERRSALTAALRQLIEADDAELIRMDAFGESVYRATFRLTADEGETTAAMLLVETPEGLRWAGMN